MEGMVSREMFMEGVVSREILLKSGRKRERTYGCSDRLRQCSSPWVAKQIDDHKSEIAGD